MEERRAGTEEFAAVLRRLRERAALSQEELAARAGVSAKAVGALERGERQRPYPHTVRALAEALALPVEDRELLSAAARPRRDGALPGGTGRRSEGPGGVEQPARPQEPDRPEPPRRPEVLVPPAPARLIGRSAEREAVIRSLRTGATRLLTLTGPGGVGKTTLALDVARALAPDFPDGVTLVELAPVREAALVLPTLAGALGARQLPAPLLDPLAAFLGERRLLVVLDNLEHVLPAATEIADLLARCPGLVVLATSRAPLRVRAELDLTLDPLALPAGSDVAAVASSPAAQVFLDRARAAGREVTLTDATAADVAAICRRLDGLPLALELAAAHARFLSPSALLSRLGQAVSSPRSRDLPERQRTVRATLDWSSELLTHDEQVLLRRLAVLVGSFSLEAAQEVAGDGTDVVPALSGLVEQSLVVPVPVPADGSLRYRMLEPIRQYAASRLEEAGEAAEVSDRAADFFRGLASGARTGLYGPDQAAWLDRLEIEHGNLGATWAWLLGREHLRAAALLAADTWLYWAVRGNAAEGLGRLERLFAAGGEQRLEPAVRGGALLARAGLRYASGDILGMRAPARAAVAAAREAAAPGLLAEALVLSGSADVFTGDLARAEEELAEAVRLSESSGTAWSHVHAVTARAQLLFRAGEIAGADAVLAVAERAARALASPFTLATVLNVQASLAQVVEDEDAALDRYLEAADLAARVATSWTLAYTLPGLAVVAARRGQAELAAELFGAGSATAEAASVAVAFPPDQESARYWLPAVRAELDEAAFQRAWERGRRTRPADVPGLARRIRRRSAPA